MKSSTLKSKLAPLILGLVAEKKACGFDFSLYASHLARLDSFIVEKGYDNGQIDEQIFVAWSKRWNTENYNTRNSRVSAMRQLVKYMESLGHSVFHPYTLGKGEKTTPYIPTKAEISALFNYVDQNKTNHVALKRFEIEYPVILRLYYHCGLRCSEAINLKRSDVNLRLGSLYIRHSKGDKDRYVFIHDDLLELMKKYDHAMDNTYLPSREWFFPGFYANKPFTRTAISGKFKHWWIQTFPEQEGQRATVQSLRHAFVVHRMDDWVSEGNELKQLMPYLSRYLGHSSIEQTMYYYHQLDSHSKAVRGILESCCPVIKGVNL